MRRFLSWGEGALLIRVALVCFAALAVTHLLGLRVNVGFLSGTVPPTWGVTVSGVLYAGCWFVGVVVAPVLLVAGVALRAASPSS